MSSRRVVQFRVTPPTGGTAIEIGMPKGAKILTVQLNGAKEVRLFAEVDPEVGYEKHRLLVLPTGYPFDEPHAAYVGTVVFPGPKELGSVGDITLHFYHLGPVPAEGAVP